MMVGRSSINVCIVEIRPVTIPGIAEMIVSIAWPLFQQADDHTGDRALRTLTLEDGLKGRRQRPSRTPETARPPAASSLALVMARHWPQSERHLRLLQLRQDP